MLVKILAYIPAVIGLLLVGAVVLLNNPQSIKNRIFALFNLLSSFWLIFLFLSDISTNPVAALWSLRFALFFGQVVPLFFYYLVLVFPFTSHINKTRQIVFGALYTVICLLTLTPLNVSKVKILDYGVLPERVGALYNFSDLLTILVIVAGLVVLMFKLRKTKSNDEKSQIKIMLWGIAFVVTVNIFTGIVLLRVLQTDSITLLLGNVALLFFSFLVAYAIVKHRLFDIRFVVARSLTYVLTLGTISVIYSLVTFGFISELLSRNTSHLTQQLFYTSAAVFLAFSFQPIKKFFDRITRKLFYRDAYDTQVLLNEFNEALVSTIELDKLLKTATTTIEKYIQPEFCSFALLNKDGSIRIISKRESKIPKELIEQSRAYLHDGKRKMFITDTLEDNQTDLKSLLQQVDIGVIARITKNPTDEGLGYMILGYKKSGNIYNSQDTAAIEILSNELAIAIENALQYEEIQNFAKTLQDKVNEATYKLRKANEKLKKMDETKDDFISMASHQLRTPLTSVKGYVSMVLEGDAGKVSSKQKELLDQAFISSQRMVYLIADLLNVSRLRTGKFVIEAKPTNLADVVEGEMNQLTETAKGRNLDLTFAKPKEFPTLMLDETKIRQVIMNFADNAIYYTPAGGHITVGLEDKGETIEFTVVDDGIGVPVSEQHHLFNKFYRAGNAKKARPDGTGLGLFMAKKVVVAQGGSIIFKSLEGKGSTFGFSFAKKPLLPEHYHGPVADEKTTQ